MMWAICEYFMGLRNTGLIVATHNHYLNKLASTYPSVKILSMNESYNCLLYQEKIETTAQFPKINE